MKFMRPAGLVLAGSVLVSAALAQGLDMTPSRAQALPTQSGQSAFGAIHEIVELLEADPNTDWNRVNIDALRQHLIDMDNVALRARVTYTINASGERIHASGDGTVRDSIQRMVLMHATMAGDTADWRMKATPTPDGADINVTAKSPRGLQKMRALGFLGMLAEGDHHPRHHMMLATGAM